MIFPEIAPSRGDCLRTIQEAFRSERARIYVDASVLIHCYEMSRSAREELLGALDGFGGRVRIPVWAAKETWDRTKSLTSRKPLSKTTVPLSRHLARFRSESLRYVDERTFDDMSMDEFTKELDALTAAGEALIKRADRIDPGHDDANARMLPFIRSHALVSDMAAIYDEVARTGEARYAHEVPPGFKDGGTKSGSDTDDGDEGELQLTGKKRNRFGDLILWLEALQDCRSPEIAHLIVLTRDNKKGDWVYKPDRVTDDNGGLQQNGGLITLPLPLLSQEAKQRCPHLEGVHVISLEMLTQVLRSGHGARVGNLVRALQADVATPKKAGLKESRVGRRTDDEDGEPVHVQFGSQDMMFDPDVLPDDHPIWSEIAALRAEGWTVTNAAALAIKDLIGHADADQAKQVGRGIVAASNDDALAPIDLAQYVLDGAEGTAEIRANLLAGMLGETYLDENGEPKKPQAHSDITAMLYEHADDVETRAAYEATIELSLAPFRHLYLALPGEEERSIRIELLLNGRTIRGIQADGKELLEENAPLSRQLVSGGRTEEMPVGDLIAAVAREFVLPASMLALEGPTNFQIELPERIGFIDWGPVSGEQLR